MKLFSYLASLLSNIGKDQILEDVRDSKEVLKSVVLPSYSAASTYFRDGKIQSKKAQELQSDFYLKYDRNGKPKSNNFITDIFNVIPDIIENCEWIEDQVEKIFEKNIISTGLTARKTALIRSAEHMSFLTRFLPDVLNYVYQEEANHLGAAMDVTVEKLSPAEEKLFRERFPMFCAILSDFSQPSKVFSKIFEKIPDVNVGGTNAEMVAGLYPDHVLDPFRSGGLAGFTWSPIYHFRMVIADWQNRSYKATQDKKKMLELRLLHLEMLKEKKYDPKIEQEIEYTRERVAKQERYLQSVRDDLGVE